jgi:hypothetical protein
MDGFVLHSATQRDINNTVAWPPHSILLVGAAGAGKGTIASLVAARLLNQTFTGLSNYPYYRHIAAKDSPISIEAIRELHGFMKLQTPGSAPIRRIVLMENAEHMTQEAQNAFLKLLEEPPSDTVIILTANSERSLLPTITSRTSTIHIKTPGKENLSSYFAAKGYADDDILKAFYISGGQPGLMSSLLEPANDNALLGYISKAKAILSTPLFLRLTMADELSKQKDQMPLLLTACYKVCHAAFSQAVDTGNDSEAKRWHKAMREISNKENSLQSNPNNKLLLTDLLLSL